MASSEELLQSIQPDMRLDKAFFLKIYGYEITRPGFKDIAIKALYDVGCSKAYEHYDRIVSEYEERQKEGMKRVAKWLREKIDSDYDKQLKEHERKVGRELSKQKSMQNDYLKKQKENLEDLIKGLKSL